jgi:hypothetical protein
MFLDLLNTYRLTTAQLLNYLLILVITFLQIADVYTTYVINSRPGGVEKNPVLAWLFKRFGLLPSLVVVKTALVLALLWTAPWQYPLLLTLLTAWYIWVIQHNLGQMPK